MSKYLNITAEPRKDETITAKIYHSYSPFVESYNVNDTVRICIQSQDLVLLPCESYLYIEGTYYENNIVMPQVRLASNCVAFMFDEIRYELNGVEIDHCRNVGITTAMKNYVSLTEHESDSLLNAGWSVINDRSIRNPSGEINFCVPLNKLFGFAEVYKKIIPNVKHELILTRSKTDDNAIIWDKAAANYKFQLKKIQWKMPHITLSDNERLILYKIIKSSNPISMAFRSWDLYEYPNLPRTTNHVWRIKTSNQLEKPRFIIFAFQTNRLNNAKESPANFDTCNLVNFKVFLNSETYPYENLNISFNKNRYADLFYMYSKFQESYYGTNIPEPLLSLYEFKEFAPMIVIDCSHQNEIIKSGPVDVKVEFQTEVNGINDNTSAFCLILHDRIVEYTPLSGEVVKKIA